MGDADELLFVAEGDDAMPILKCDSARGSEARYADDNMLVEEDATVCVASAFRHEVKVKATPRCATCAVS